MFFVGLEGQRRQFATVVSLICPVFGGTVAREYMRKGYQTMSDRFCVRTGFSEKIPLFRRVKLFIIITVGREDEGEESILLTIVETISRIRPSWHERVVDPSHD